MPSSVKPQVRVARQAGLGAAASDCRRGGYGRELLDLACCAESCSLVGENPHLPAYSDLSTPGDQPLQHLPLRKKARGCLPTECLTNFKGQQMYGANN